MSDFQWRTDEEDGRWDDPPPAPAADPAPDASRRRRRLLFSLALLAIGAIAAVVVYRRATAEVAAAQAQVAADVVSGYEVVRRAAESRDRELFTSVLSGRDDAWTDAMQNVVEGGLLFDRPLLGLHARPAPTVPTDTVRLADDLQAAELQVPIRYELDAGNGVTTTVTLSQTHIFRRGSGQRWLFAPPLEEFWGESREIRGQRLSVAFPARDAQLAERLVADLDRKLQEACALPDVGCADDLRLSVIFSTDPVTLHAGRNDRAWLEQLPPLRLPAPTLVGLPRDTDGYGALLRGYGRLLTRRLLADAAGYECCTAALFTQALLSYQLDRLGLQPWPLGREEFVRLAGDLEALESPLVASRMATFDWIYEGEAWIRAYATIQFLLETTPEVTAGELLRLSQRQREELLEARNIEQWLAFVGAGTRPAGEHPASTTAWTLTTICGATFDPDLPPPAALVRHTYSLATGTGQTGELPFEPGIGVPIPGSEALLLVGAERQAFFYVPAPDGVPLEVGRPEELTGFPIFAAPVPGLNRAILFYIPDGGPENIATLDLEQCAAGACNAVPLSGFPRWSPTGRWGLTSWQLFFQPEDGTYLIDEAGERVREIGRSWRPAQHGTWLDDRRFAYLSDGTVYLEDVAGGEPRALFTGNDAVLAVGEPAAGNPRFVDLAGTANGLVAAIAVEGGTPDGTLVVRYNVEDDTFDQVYRDERFVLDISLSPDRQQLLLLSASISHFTLIDLEDGNTRGYDVRDPIPIEQEYWSPDGEWLLLPGEGVTRLVHLESGEYRFLPYGSFDGCLRSAWSQP